MHSLLKTTTASAALAAAFAVSPIALLAQEAPADEAATAADPATADAGAQDMAAEGAASGEAAADDTMMAEEDATAAEPAEGTEMAQGAATGDEAATEDAAATEMAQDTATEDAATAEGTDMAADDAAAAEPTEEGIAAAGEDAATETEGTQDMETAAGDVPAQPTEPMATVLEKLAELGAPPIGTVSVEEQRAAPTPADAVMAVMEEQGIEMPAELAAIATRDITYPAADGSEQPLRVYTPEGEGPFPLIVYYHGGGWVLADLDTYDASARALAAGADAVVVSVEYRHAPENPFPAAHEDANAAYAWIVENSGSLNADAERLAVAGESAGGNLAINVAINARDAQLVEPDHMLLVYPVAGDDMETASYQSYAEAQPLSREAMMWFVENVFEDPSQAADPRIDLVAREDLAGLPPATIINAEIDPLTSEGVTLGARLQEAGVEASQMTYPGVTHEFFGMGAVVPTAQEAVDMATANLTEAFGAGSAEGLVNDAATADAATDAAGDAPAADVTDVEATAAEGAADPAATGDAAATEDGAAMEMEPAAEPMEGDAAADTAN